MAEACGTSVQAVHYIPALTQLDVFVVMTITLRLLRWVKSWVSECNVPTCARVKNKLLPRKRAKVSADDNLSSAEFPAATASKNQRSVYHRRHERPTRPLVMVMNEALLALREHQEQL